MKFLADNAFKAPAWALNAEILRRIEPVGVLDRIEASQTRVLNALLSSARVQRLVEQDAIDGAAAYAPLEFLGDVRRGVWSEIYGTGAPKIDAYRRNLQRAYVETLSNRVNGSQAQSDDARAFFRGELKTLDNDLAAALPRQPDRATQLHIEDVRMQIARALDPSVQASSPGARTEHRARGRFAVRCHRGERHLLAGLRHRAEVEAAVVRLKEPPGLRPGATMSSGCVGCLWAGVFGPRPRATAP